ncbi:hypothetical protein ACXR5E_003331 [Vibrio mimicus]
MKWIILYATKPFLCWSLCRHIFRIKAKLSPWLGKTPLPEASLE